MHDFLFLLLLLLLILSHYFPKLKYIVLCFIALHRVIDSEPPAFYGSFWPFLAFIGLISYLGLGACHEVWVMLRMGLYMQHSERRGGVRTWGGLRGQSRVII